MRAANGQDAMCCDRCGDVATSFHEDFGNLCPACAKHWQEKWERERSETRFVQHRDGGFARGE